MKLWVELFKYYIKYELRKSIKSQYLVDFMSELRWIRKGVDA